MEKIEEKGKMKKGDEFINEQIIGQILNGSVEREEEVEGRKEIVN